MVNTINGDGTMTATCDGCGAVMTLPEPKAGALHDWLIDLAHGARCEQCVEREIAHEAEERREQRRATLAADVAERLREMGVPSGMVDIVKAPNAALGEWLWNYRTKCVIIGGASGVGKTTAAAAVMHCMAMKRRLKGRYCTLGELSGEWLAACRGERGGQDAFWWRLGRLDLLAIDEMIGRAGFGKYSAAVQELVSGIIDRCYTGAFCGAVWFLGNFHRGAWNEVFDEPRAVIRRLQEKFSCVWVEPGTVRGMEVG